MPVTGTSPSAHASEDAKVARTHLPRNSERSSLWLHSPVLLGYLFLSVACWSHVWITGHPTHAITCQCGDPSEEVWWFAWLPWALLHGHNPFLTNALFAGSGGVNALANVSVMLPALVLSPVTLLFGPIASFNVAATLAPVVSAYCMFLFMGKVARFAPSRVIAGLVWGFSPYVFGNLPFGHLLDVLGFFLPLSGLIAYDLLVEHKRRPWIDGALFGLLAICQFFTGTETLAIVALTVPVGFVVIPRVIWRNRTRLVAAATTALALCGVTLSYPAWFAVAGPRHVSGRIRTALVTTSRFSVVDSGPIHRAAGPIAEISGYWGKGGPGSGYLGWGILGFIAVSFFVWRKRRLAWSAALIGVWAWMLSWGASTTLAPWKLFEGLPVISSVEPFRFADPMMFCAALLVAIGIDQWWQQSRVLGVAATVGATVALLSVAATYSLPFVEHSPPTPAWFSHNALSLRPGTRLLTIPYPGVGNSMVYQAEDSMRFDLTGGYMLVPGPGNVSIWRLPLEGATAVFTLLSSPIYPQPSLSIVDSTRKTIEAWRINESVVDPSKGLPYAIRYLTAVYGRAPIRERGAAVWKGLPRTPA